MKVRHVMLLGLLLGGCGEATMNNNASESKYIVAGVSAAGVVKYVGQESIKLCLNDSTGSATRRETVKGAIMKWVDALREVSDTELAASVEVVASNQPCHLAVNVGNYDPAQTQMGSKPIVYIAYSGWYGSNTVILHELGHAFGLLDTYNGRGGSCQSGQPNSVMCRANYAELQEDDILGVRKVYERVQAASAAGITLHEDTFLVE